VFNAVDEHVGGGGGEVREPFEVDLVLAHFYFEEAWLLGDGYTGLCGHAVEHFLEEGGYSVPPVGFWV